MYTAMYVVYVVDDRSTGMYIASIGTTYTYSSYIYMHSSIKNMHGMSCISSGIHTY